MRADVLGRGDYTAEEAFWLNPSGVWELVDGRFVFMSPAGAATLTGDAALACPELLGAFALRLSDLWS